MGLKTILGGLILGAVCGLSCSTSIIEAQMEPPRTSDGIHQLPPVDEAQQDVAFRALRDRLVALARARNDQGIREVMTPELRARVAAPLDFRELERALALGGVFTSTRGAVVGRREFCAPYVYSAFPKLSDLRADLGGEFDPWVILERDVPVRTRPSLDAPIVGRLSYEIVRLTEGEIIKGDREQTQWAVIKLPRGLGFVPASTVRSTFDFCVCFAQFGDDWRMTVFERRFPTAAG